MGQKANPNGMRLGIVKDWKAKWFASSKKQWAEWTVEDKRIRIYFDKIERDLGISKLEIERTTQQVKVIITSIRTGAILGEKGTNVKEIEKEIAKIMKDRSRKVIVEVKEEKNPDYSAKIIAREIAIAIENRVSFRIAQKRVIRRVMRSGVKGIKTLVSGRLNGVDMARSEGYSEGIVPLQTFRNNIDFAIEKAQTTYGVIGVKVWISKGEILDGEEIKRPQRPSRRPYQNRGDRKPYQKRNDAVSPSTPQTPVAPKGGQDVTTKENKI